MMLTTTGSRGIYSSSPREMRTRRLKRCRPRCFAWFAISKYSPMNESQDNERLLADILAEGDVAGRREALLGNTLKLVRRRRHFRQVRRGAYTLVLIAAVALVLWRHGAPVNLPPLPAKPYTLVRS